MAQSASIPAPVGPAVPGLPLESFLATDDPVWVWDGQGRRIVWANAAAARLWGDPTSDQLKRRRTGKRTGAPARLTELARSPSDLADHVEALRVPTPSGGTVVSCVVQRLQLAGNRPGLVVRALQQHSQAQVSRPVAVRQTAEDAPAGQNLTGRANGQTPPPPRRPADRSDVGTLKAIARQISDAADRGRETGADSPPPLDSTQPKPPTKPAPATKQGSSDKKRGNRTRAKSKDDAALSSGPSSEEMAALLARVSHEIRNPLTIILGFAEILKSDRADRLRPGKAKEYASDIYRTARLALGLADDLLGFAERANGEPPPHEWVDLNALVADCLHLLEPVAVAQGVTLSRRLKRGAPLLLAHERSIRQILLNLLTNALRHGDGGGKIRVMTRLDRDGGLILSVKDDGPGMTPEQIASAKAPERAGDVKAAGRRGLGLRLVVGFVRDNHGALDIISKPGEGTDIRIRFGPDRLRTPKPKKPSGKPKQRPQKKRSRTKRN